MFENAIPTSKCKRWYLFFTVNLTERKRALLVDSVNSLHDVFRAVKNGIIENGLATVMDDDHYGKSK